MARCFQNVLLVGDVLNLLELDDVGLAHRFKRINEARSAVGDHGDLAERAGADDLHCLQVG